MANFESIRIEFRSVVKPAFKAKSLDLIKTKFKPFNRSEIDLKNPLDQAFRDVLLEFLEKEIDVGILKEFVHFSIDCCRQSLATPTLPVVMLVDIFDALTLNICEDMFSFVEDNVLVWKEDLFISGCKNNLLRLCNDLLKRLSRSTSTIFCGRILLFLAKFFPFSERSGLNVVSEFNLENTTEYGNDSSEDFSKEIETVDQKKIVINFTLYCKFWSLQDFFRYPAQCYDKTKWKAFTVNAASVLSTFQGLKLEYVVKNVETEDKKSNLYFSKYLTSQKLLDLQLYDNNFRRFVLIQFLILFQYLTSAVKFKSDSFELKNEQKEWITATTEKVYSLLKETPPDGVKFAEIISNILAREEFWNAWKNDGCPAFKMPGNAFEPADSSKAKLDRPAVGDLIKAANNDHKFYMGSTELTKLWNLCPDNLEACKGTNRDFLPTMENYFSDAIEQLESNVPVKDENNLFKNSNFGWRALRLLARRSPYFFTYTTIIVNQQSSYLEIMIRRIMQEQKSKKEGVGNAAENQQESEEMVTLYKEESENPEDINKGDTEEFVEEKTTRPEKTSLTEAQLAFIAEKVTPGWKKLAAKLGYVPNEITFFETENAGLALPS